MGATDPDDDMTRERRWPAWPTPAVPGDIETEVRRRLSATPLRSRTPPFGSWFSPAFLSLAGACCALLLLCGLQWHALREVRSRDHRLAESYLRMIDPRVNGGPGANVDETLAWMQQELNLTAAQAAQLRRLHEETEAVLQQYAGEWRRVEAADAAVEARRREDSEVDFIAVAAIRSEQSKVSRGYSDAQSRLVAASTAIMRGAQKQRYLRLIAPAFSGAGAHDASHGG